jgi:predicted transporter
MFTIYEGKRAIPFSEACMKIGAAVVIYPTMFAGLAICIGGLFATIGLCIPGIMAWAATKSITNDDTKAETVGMAVTGCVAILGFKIYDAGRKCGLYLGIVKMVKIDLKPLVPSSVPSSRSSP